MSVQSEIGQGSKFSFGFQLKDYTMKKEPTTPSELSTVQQKIAYVDKPPKV